MYSSTTIVYVIDFSPINEVYSLIISNNDYPQSPFYIDAEVKPFERRKTRTPLLFLVIIYLLSNPNPYDPHTHYSHCKQNRNILCIYGYLLIF